MANAFILHVNSCLTPTDQVHNASILFRDGLIMAVGGYSALRVLDEIPSVDLTDCQAVPGFIDTHIHGTGGFDAMHADVDGNVGKMCQVLATHGTTSLLPTVLSGPSAKMLAVTEALATHCEEEGNGAVPVGIHLEGPFLNVKKRGAQGATFLREIDLGFARELLEAGRGKVRTMTFAPELEHSEELVGLLLENGVVASMGHSLANAENATRAIAAGASRCTHLFNGTPLLDQREAGLTSIALTDDRLTIELIPDGIHVHPSMVDLACRAKPKDRIVAITDATQGAGLDAGRYYLGDDEIIVANGACRRVSDGRLAGSCLTSDHAFRNLLRFTSMSPSDALACFTINAAQSIGLTDRGLIQPGKRGDVVVVDENWEVQLTVVQGRIVYDPRGAAADQPDL